MSNYNYDVLIVDDVSSAAEDYAKIITAKLGLKATFTTDPIEAEKIVRNSDLKVVVLDQVMPVRGTELLPKLKKINPYLKSLMLTGEASNEEIGSAVNLGFDGYLDKKKIAELEHKVRGLYADFECSFAERLSTKKPNLLKVLFKWPVPRKIFILYRTIINDAYVDDTKKETILEIFAGQEKVKTKQINEVKELEIDEANEQSVCFDLKITSDDLGSIKTKLANISSFKKKAALQISETMSVKYKLPQNVEGQVDHRIIECCPVYEITKVILGIRQMFDKELRRSCLFIRKFTGKYQIVQTDYGHNNEVKVTNLGVHSLVE